MGLQHQLGSTSDKCPRCGKPYTVGLEHEHHCGKQIGAERLAPPGVIVDSYRRAMGLPPAKDAPVNKPVNTAELVNTSVNTSAAELVHNDESGQVDRKAYRREWTRKRRAADKAAKDAPA